MNAMIRKTTLNFTIQLQSIYYHNRSTAIRSVHNVSNNHEFRHEFLSFRKTLPLIKNEVCARINCEIVRQRFSELFDYQMLDSIQTRAKVLLNVHKVMNSQSEYSKRNENDLSPLYVMAWTVELCQAAIVIIDDIIDESTFRRDRIPWHYGNERSVSCDTSILFASASLLFTKYFRNTPFFVSASELIQQEYILNQCTYQAREIYLLDVIRSKGITWDFYYRYNADKVVYTLSAPFKLAACMALNSDLIFDYELNKLLIEMCYFGALIDDGMEYLESLQNGNFINGDIKSGKITFFLTHVMQNASQDDVNFIAAHYGKKNSQNIDEIMRIFKKFDLTKEYAEHRISKINYIEQRIQNLSTNNEKFKDGLKIILDMMVHFRNSNPSEIISSV